MRISRGLLMPAAAEVRQMLHRIKLDNAARHAQINGGGCGGGGKIQNSTHVASASASAFLAESDAFVYCAAEAQHQRQQQRLRGQREHVKRLRTLSDGDSLFARAAQASLAE